MKLYTSPGSCSSASHITLIESGLEFELVKLNLRESRSLPDGRELADINPKNYVPVLELDDGQTLTESVAILQYIADQSPDSGLAPAYGTLERVRLQEWLAYVNSEVHKTCSILFMPFPDEAKAIAKQKLALRYEYIEHHLENNKYLLGDQFTVADAYLFIVLSWAPMLEVDLSPYPNMVAYQARISERDSVKAYYAALNN